MVEAATLRVLDLFSGLGAMSLGLERAGGFRTVAFCEIEPFARAILKKNWPDVPCYDDVRTLTAERLAADGVAVDVVTGGFPCQDLSSAGTRSGIDGERSGLWGELARLLGELRPRYAIMENVSDLLEGNGGAWFGRFLGDLAEIGRDALWHCIPASYLGAPIVRDRAWIVSVPHEEHGKERLAVLDEHLRAVFQSTHEQGLDVWAPSSCPPAGMAHGPADRLDKFERTEAIGNSLVPQIPELIGRAILAAQGIEAGGPRPGTGLGAEHESPTPEGMRP